MGPGQSLMLNQGLSLQSSQSMRLIPTGNKVGNATTSITKTVVQFAIDHTHSNSKETDTEPQCKLRLSMPVSRSTACPPTPSPPCRWPSPCSRPWPSLLRCWSTYLHQPPPPRRPSHRRPTPAWCRSTGRRWPHPPPRHLQPQSRKPAPVRCRPCGRRGPPPPSSHKPTPACRG